MTTLKIIDREHNEIYDSKENPHAWFYYYRDSQRRPVVTVCLLEKDDLYYRGVAICSLDDQPVKARGRAIAWLRAVRALKYDPHAPIDIMPTSSEKAQRVFEFAFMVRDPIRLIWGGKSVPGCRLTDFERRLVERKNDH